MIAFVQNAPLGVFLFMLALPAAMIGIGVFVAHRTLGQINALKAAVAIKPAEAKPGYFRVDGLAAPAGKPLKAPLTQVECVWYRIRVEAWTRGSDKKSDWRTERAEESERAFKLRFEDGELRVDPDGADITPFDRSLWYGAGPEPEDRDPKRFKPWENPKGDVIQVEIAGTANTRYRYTEERIYDANPVFVLGEIAADGRGKFVLRKPETSSGPFLISTTEPSAHLDLQRHGVIGLILLAAVGVALFGVLAWMRFA